MKTKDEIKDAFYKVNAMEDVIGWGFRIMLLILAILYLIKRCNHSFLVNLSVEDLLMTILIVMLIFIFGVRYIEKGSFSREKKIKSLEGKLYDKRAQREGKIAYLKAANPEATPDMMKTLIEKELDSLEEKILELEVRLEMLQ